MRKLLQFVNTEPLYPFLLGVYPVLLLWQVNFTQVFAVSVTSTLAFAVIFSAADHFLARLLIRDKHRAAAITGVILFFFSSYGHLFKYIDSLKILGVLVGRHRYFLPLWAILAVLCVILVFRARNITPSFSAGMNKVSALLTLLVIIQLVWAGLQYRSVTNKKDTVKPATAEIPAGAQKPDVYYLMFDSYSRPDVLAKYYDIDVTKFIAELRDMGFKVPSCNQSNYQTTTLSVGTTLNMDYLYNLGIPDSDLLGYLYDNNPKLFKIDQNNVVMETFNKLGYKTVVFKSITPHLNFQSADVFYDFDRDGNLGDSLESLNFRSFYLQTTVLEGFHELLTVNPALTGKIPLPVLRILFPELGVSTTPNYRQYLQNLYLLEKLQQIPRDISGPKFVFAHAFITHTPFTFNPGGDYRWPSDESPAGYRDQVLYLNSVLPDILRKIISQSAVPPVIIFQSDHSFKYGPDRLKNFSAYYLPGGVDARVYDKMTAVNIFRLVFSSYFGLDTPLIKDQSYYLNITKTGVDRVTPQDGSCWETTR